MKKILAGILSLLMLITGCNTDGALEADLLVRFSENVTRGVESKPMDTESYRIEIWNSDRETAAQPVNAGKDATHVSIPVMTGNTVVTVSALNRDGDVIGRGETSLNVRAGVRNECTVTVTELAGNGTVSFLVEMTDPHDITAELYMGSDWFQGRKPSYSTLLKKNADGSGYSGSVEAANGFYSVVFRYGDGSVLCEKDTVRVVKGGSVLVKVAAVSGGLHITVGNMIDSTPSLVLYGPDVLGLGKSCEITAEVTGMTDPHFRWYLDSDPVGTDSPVLSLTAPLEIKTEYEVHEITCTAHSGSKVWSEKHSITYRNGGIPTIIWYAVGNGRAENHDTWTEQVNAYLESRLGCHLDYRCIPWGDWDGTRAQILRNSEPWDIMFGNDSTFFHDARNGEYARLDDLLKRTPGLTDLIPEGYWKAVTVNGGIYGVPTYKDSSITYYWLWTKSIVDKYGIPYQSLHRMADIRPWAEKVHEGEGGPVMYLAQDAPEYMGYDSLGMRLPAIGVKYDDPSMRVVRAMEMPDYMAYLNEVRTWFLEGLINSDAGTLGQVPTYMHLCAAWGWPAAAESAWGPGRGCEVVVSQWNDTIVDSRTVLGSLNSINSVSSDRLMALKLLELVNTDAHLRDLLKYGEEGYNFVYNADGTVHKLGPQWTAANYTQGTFFVGSIEEGEDPQQWKEIRELDDAAYPSVMLGFSFDASSVQNELINCRNIYDKYRQLIITGSVDPGEMVPRMYAEMDASGLQKIIDEVQRQIDRDMKPTV